MYHQHPDPRKDRKKTALPERAYIKQLNELLSEFLARIEQLEDLVKTAVPPVGKRADKKPAEKAAKEKKVEAEK